jgi:hypothetical protein
MDTICCATPTQFIDRDSGGGSVSLLDAHFAQSRDRTASLLPQVPSSVAVNDANSTRSFGEDLVCSSCIIGVIVFQQALCSGSIIDGGVDMDKTSVVSTSTGGEYSQPMTPAKFGISFNAENNNSIITPTPFLPYASKVRLLLINDGFICLDDNKHGIICIRFCRRSERG